MSTWSFWPFALPHGIGLAGQATTSLASQPHFFFFFFLVKGEEKKNRLETLARFL